jgi:imidazolonepropionase-like amidohydrolase
MKKQLYTVIIAFALVFQLSGQQVEKTYTGTFLLKGGKVETVYKGVIDADVLIEDGLIKEVAEDIGHPGAQLIDCKGLIIYPGMIDSGTKLGLGEISAVSLTQDHNELGEYTPHMEALTAVNPSSVNIPVTRVNGVTTVLTVPDGGLLPGTAALINLQGYTPDQMFAGFKGVVLNFPSTGRRGRRDSRSDEDIAKANKKAQDNLKKYWANAKIHAAMASKGEVEYNPQYEALRPVIDKEASLLITVNKKSDILQAIKWVNENDIKAIFTGVAEGYRVADSLAKYNIPVITGPILDNPARASDKYDSAYANAGIMQKAGVKVAIQTNETENVRNLPYNAAFAAAYGMGWREAFKAVTVIPAEIFGISDKYGTIERGKVANVFVADGDPFETKTQVKHLFISGYKVPLESRHTLLYNEFLDRDPGLNKE